ncbi:MAG: O-antigen ligase family protein [Pseudomonadota bacterium]
MVNYAVRRSIPYSLAQALIGWSALAATLATALAFGGDTPLAWIALAVVAHALLGAQVALNLARGAPGAAHRAALPLVFFLLALVWGLIQTIAAPATWAHPLWALVPAGTPTISADPIAGQHYVLRLTTYAALFWIVLNAATNARRATAFLTVIALFSTLLAAYGLAASLTGINPVLGPLEDGNVKATFLNRNSYATYAIFGILANLGLYLQVMQTREPTRDRRRALRHVIERFFASGWIFAFGALLCLAALLIGGSRAGSAAGILAIAVLALCVRSSFGKSRALWIPVAVGIIVVLIGLSGTVRGRIARAGADPREFVYPEIIAGLGERPILGHGLGAFGDTFHARVPLEAAGFEWSRAHNAYLQNLWELGLPAAALFYAPLAWLGFALLRGAWVRRRERLYVSVALAAYVAGGLHALVDFSFQIPAVCALFAVLMGIGCAHARPRLRA